MASHLLALHKLDRILRLFGLCLVAVADTRVWIDERGWQCCEVIRRRWKVARG